MRKERGAVDFQYNEILYKRHKIGDSGELLQGFASDAAPCFLQRFYSSFCHAKQESRDVAHMALISRSFDEKL